MAGKSPIARLATRLLPGAAALLFAVAAPARDFGQGTPQVDDITVPTIARASQPAPAMA